MTPSYEDRPIGLPKKTGIPRWAWALIGCVILPVVLTPISCFSITAYYYSLDRKRNVACISNLHVQSQALSMYMQDYDDTFFQINTKWMDLLQERDKRIDDAVLTCPEAPIGKDGKMPAYGYATNLEMNGYVMSEMINPEDSIVIFDARTPKGMKNVMEDTSSLALRHRQSRVVNVVFADGHVKSMEEEDFQELADPVWKDPENPGVRKPAKETKK